jgi:hypothetical protein
MGDLQISKKLKSHEGGTCIFYKKEILRIKGQAIKKREKNGWNC